MYLSNLMVVLLANVACTLPIPTRRGHFLEPVARHPGFSDVQVAAKELPVRQLELVTGLLSPLTSSSPGEDKSGLGDVTKELPVRQLDLGTIISKVTSLTGSKVRRNRSAVDVSVKNVQPRQLDGFTGIISSLKGSMQGETESGLEGVTKKLPIRQLDLGTIVGKVTSLTGGSLAGREAPVEIQCIKSEDGQCVTSTPDVASELEDACDDY